MSFGSYLKSKLKQILGLSVLAAMTVSLVMPGGVSQAAEPRFNFLSGDYELLRGRNVSTTPPETVWKDPVSGTAGDVIEGLVYYHNGIEGSTATNTRVRVDIPATTTGNTAVLSAAIVADNAATVTDTIVDGHIVGASGLTINLDRPATLALVPGSVQWYPEAQTKGVTASTPLPGGQTGNEITQATGVTIGDVQGCWPFAGFVTFKVKTTAQALDVTLEKLGRNISRTPATALAETTEAFPGENVEFSVAIKNNSVTPISDLTISDTLPVGTDLALNSALTISGPGGVVRTITELSTISQFFGAGIPLGFTVNPGETYTLTFTMRVDENLTTEKSLVNMATLKFGTQTLTNTATVLIKIPTVNVGQSKTVHNVTTGKTAEDTTIDGVIVKALTAREGDRITYTLTAKNNGVKSVDYVVSDDLTDVLEYADFESASDAGSLSGKTVTYPSVNLPVGVAINRTFTVKIKSPLPNIPAKGSSYDDKLVNIYGNQVVVTIERVAKIAVLSVKKDVRNLTTNEANFADSNEAFAGDILEYKIAFANTGTAPADGVKFADVLPANTQYVQGTTVISRNGGDEKTVIDGLTGSGITIDTIAAGEFGYLKFRVVTSTKIAEGETLTNTIHATYQTNTLTDTATTKIKVPKVAAPSLPRTGTAAGGGFSLTFLVGLCVSYVRYRKEIADTFEVVRIASEILG